MRAYARARSGLRCTVPTLRAVPSASRYSASEDRMSSKYLALSCACSLNVLSITNPRCATSMPGCSTRRSDHVPYRCSARSQPATVPGTPPESPL